MSVVNVGTEYNTGDTDVTDHDISLPASLVTGNTILVIMTLDGQGGGTSTDLTEILDVPHSTSSTQIWAGYRTITGTEGSTVRVTTAGEHAVGWAIQLEDVDDSTFSFTSAEGAASTNHDPPNHTPSGGAIERLWFAIAGVNGGITPPFSQWALPDTQYSGATGGSGAAGGGWCTDILSDASVNPQTFISDVSQTWVAATMSVETQAASAPVPSRVMPKPARWAVNPGMVAPSWRWAWQGLTHYLPMWATPSPRSAGVRTDWVDVMPAQWEWSGSGSMTFDLVPSAVGLTWEVAVPATNTGPSIRSLPVDISVFPAFTVVMMTQVTVDPTSAQDYQMWEYEGLIGLEYEGASADFYLNGSLPAVNLASSGAQLNTWYTTVVRAEAGSGGAVNVDIYETSSGTEFYSASTTWSGTGTSQEMHLWWGNGGTGENAMFALWNYRMTDEQMRVLVRDPFGPIRPAGTLIVPLVESGTLHSGAGVANSSLQMVGAGTLTLILLYATADGTINSVVNEVDTTVNLYASVDDSPSSPTDTDWINNTAGTGSVFLDLTNMPSDFGTMDTLKLTVRWRGQTYIGNKSIYAQIFQSNETTSMSDEVLVATATGDSSFANTTQVTFTGLDTSSGKAVWDGARIRLRWA